ncbi:hypothetical protein BDB00DRAFT_178716 [Zychaea mexicana]|uniref:uncharacterized protein n=1 Tax=Zychaea mexicana TaxID=64656 RepID=UPI0022FDC4A5|nr:uncharacterized protein BDB00DRAFT_178716 [Zychaea mexicana]KAI9495965.1 hypothetical protein BDB00DRAFT_178716 [Zychaea mexicana]
MSLFSKLTKNNDKSIYPWSQRKISSASQAFPRSGHASAVLPSDQILIFGGVHRNTGKRELISIDSNSLSVNSLSTAGDLPSPRCYATFVSIGNFALLYGGEPTMPDEKWDPHVYIYNSSNRHWTRIRMEGHIPVERSRHTSVMVDGAMYIWGGQRAGRYLDDMVAFNTNTYPSNPQWEYITPNGDGPSARAGHASVIFDNKLYIFGGTDGDHLYNDIWAFDLQARIWMQVPAVGYIPVPRTDFSCAMVDGVMYIFGGRGPDGQDLGDLCAFRIKSQRWYMFQNMGPTPSARHGLSIATVKEKMIVLGGDNNVGRLDDVSNAYILDSSKIRYPPEAAAQQAPPITPSPSSNSFNEHDSSLRGKIPSNIQNSQSTPVRSPPPNSSQPYQSQHYPYQQQQQQQYNDPTIPFRENELEPQVSASTPVPGSSSSNPSQQQQQQQQQQHSKQHEGKPRHASVVPEAARRRTRTTSPMPFSDVDTTVSADGSIRQQHGPLSPSSTTSAAESLEAATAAVAPIHPPAQQQPQQQQSPHHPRNTMNGITPPPRPSREGVKLNNTYRHTMTGGEDYDDRPKTNGHATQHPSPQPQSQQPQPSPPQQQQDILPLTPPSSSQSTTRIQEEKAALVRELRAREMIVSEMRKKEQWWRTEVSIARKIRAEQGHALDNDDDDEELMDLTDSEKYKLFDQLVAMKTELRRVKQSIGHQAQPMSQKVEQADRMRLAALQEAAYFKAKYQALKARQPFDETDRTADLEKRLATALSEHESNTRLLQQLQQRAHHDHTSRVSADERAKEAHERAQEAQEAHQRALEELASVHDRAVKAEGQAREGAVQIAELTRQLAQALSTPEASSHDLSEAHITISKLEAANLKARNEVASLKQKLAESMDDIARLRTMLSEREEALKETTRELEDSEIQMAMLRDAMNRMDPPTAAAGGATAATASATTY